MAFVKHFGASSLLQFQEGQVVFLNQLFIGKAEVFVIAYYDVVQDLNLQFEFGDVLV